MESTGTHDAALVLRAQTGDRKALDELVSAHLPLVYAIVRRALVGYPDADDVVQETMLRALRELRELRTPESFRAWLAAIATRQVSTYLRRQHLAEDRVAALEELAGEVDADADIESLTMLQLELSGQRRQVVLASRWLDPDDRALLSLWWLEVAGQLSRTELATAIGVSVAHAGVRVQRMRNQLEASRALVAAVEMPRCGELATMLSSWDGQPSPLWRKRIGRHIRSCPICEGGGESRVATERLLVGLALLPVPLALAVTLRGKTVAFAASEGAFTVATGASAGAGLHAGVLSRLVHTVAAHPLIAAAVTGVVLASGTVAALSWPSSAPPVRAVSAPPATPAQTEPSVSGEPTVGPSRPGGPPTEAPKPPKPDHADKAALSAGLASLEAVSEAGFFVSTAATYGVLAKMGPGAAASAKQQATFEVVAGLADSSCFSFRLPDGEYLRHSSWRLRVSPDDGSDLFKGDATFCVRAGTAPGSISLESANYPGWFLHHRGNDLWVDPTDGTATFMADSSFRTRPGLAV
jgi:RNA polymerase sigma factor (sigma-70 family)